MLDIISIEDDNSFINEVLNCNLIVLVDFWSPSCVACVSMFTILDQLSKDYDKNTVKIVKINVFSNRGIASKYNVSSLPTLLFFNKGNIVDTKVGVHKKEELSDIIDSLCDNCA